MTDRELREAYARVVAECRSTARADCVSPEDLAEIVRGNATEAERLERLRHVTECPACRAELDMIRATAAAGHRLAPFRVPGLAAAAAVILMVAAGTVLWRVTGADSGPPIMRGDGAAVQLVGPLGETSREGARTLIWRPAGDVLEYDVELLGPAGTLVFATTTTDTLLGIPESVTLAAGVEYRWRVRSLHPDGTRTTSGLQPFRIQIP